MKMKPILLLKSRVLTSPRSRSLCLNSFRRKRRTSEKRLPTFEKKWHIRQEKEISKNPLSSEKSMMHVINKEENLVSVSTEYTVFIQAIAAANMNFDTDLFLEGRHLNIPLDVQKITVVTGLDSNNKQDTSLGLLEKDDSHQTIPMQDTLMDVGLNIYNKQGICVGQNKNPCNHWIGSMQDTSKNKIVTMQPYHHFSLAMIIGCFLVLFPLLTALCIKFITGAFHNRSAMKSKHQFHDLKKHNHESKTLRWKSVLHDSSDYVGVDAESNQDSDDLEDQPEGIFEATSHDYSQVESSYQQFLDECGMSKWGYWRGGSSK